MWFVVRTYRTLLGMPGAAAFFVAACVGRLGIAMTSLAIVWLVHSEAGSFGVAGVVAAGFAVAEGLVGPQMARFIDRYGQTRILPPLLLAHAAAVATMVFIAVTGGPAWSLVAGGILMGSTIPQLGALSGTRWSGMLRDRHSDLLHSAFALEALANGAAYLIGPGVASVLGAAGHAVVGTAIAGGLIVSGGLALSLQRRTAPPVGVEREHRSRDGGLLTPGFAVFLALNVGLGGFFSLVRLGVTAFGTEKEMAALAGVLFVLSNAANLAAGWLYGLIKWPGTRRVQLAVAAAGLAVGSVPLVFAGSPLLAGAGVVATGLMLSVIGISGITLIQATIRPSVLTQGFTWLNSASAAGSAAFAALGGVVIDRAGAHGGFLLLLAVTTFIAGIGGLGLRLLPADDARRGGDGTNRQHESLAEP